MREINHIPFVDGEHYSTKESWSILLGYGLLLIVAFFAVQLV